MPATGTELPFAQRAQIRVVIEESRDMKMIGQVGAEREILPFTDVGSPQDVAGVRVQRSGRRDPDGVYAVIPGPDRLDQRYYPPVHAGPFGVCFHSLVHNGLGVIGLVECSTQMSPADVNCDDCAHGYNYTVPDRAMPSGPATAFIRQTIMPVMFRGVGTLRVFPILLILLAAVIGPVAASGYADLSRAEELRRTGEVPLAAQYYESAARKLPWKPDLWDLAASSYAVTGHWEKAMPLFEVARRLGVLSSNSWVLYGLAYEVGGHSQEARDTWAEGLKHFPKEAAFYYWIASDDRRRNDFSAEAQHLSVWVAAGRPQAEHHYRLGELLMTSNPDRARKEFQEAASMDQGFKPAVLTLQASLDLAGRESDQARRLVLLGRGLGLVYEWPLAQDIFERAVNADPRNAEAWAWLGESRQQNKLDGKRALDKALEVSPNSSLVHALRGLYWKRQTQYVAAVAEYQAAARLEPKIAEWQAALGDAYAATGDLVSALAAYQAATSLAEAYGLLSGLAEIVRFLLPLIFFAGFFLAADFFFALDEELQVDRQAAALLEMRLHRLDVHEHLALVVGGAARIDLAVAHGGFKRRTGPQVHRIDRLHVVVAVEQHMRRAGLAVHLADDCGMTGCRPHLGGKAKRGQILSGRAGGSDLDREQYGRRAAKEHNIKRRRQGMHALGALPRQVGSYGGNLQQDQYYQN